MESKTARELLEEAYSHLLLGDMNREAVVGPLRGRSGWIKNSEGWFTTSDGSTSVNCAIGAIALANMTHAEKRSEGAYVSFFDQARHNPEVFKAGLAVVQAIGEFEGQPQEYLDKKWASFLSAYHHGLHPGSSVRGIAVQEVAREIYSFNDADSTKYQDVLGVFERGIKILIEEEEKA